MEFLKANGIEDPTLMKEIDYQEVLNQQEIYGEELNLFSNKERQKEVREVQIIKIRVQLPLLGVYHGDNYHGDNYFVLLFSWCKHIHTQNKKNPKTKRKPGPNIKTPELQLKITTSTSKPFLFFFNYKIKSQ